MPGLSIKGGFGEVDVLGNKKIESLGRGRHARHLESYVFALRESIRHLRLSRGHQHLLPCPSLLLLSSFFSLFRFPSLLPSPSLPCLTLTSPVAPSPTHSLSGSTSLPSICCPIHLTLLRNLTSHGGDRTPSMERPRVPAHEAIHHGPLRLHRG